MPRQGHLEAALRIMGYLKFRHNSRLAFDPSYPDTDHSSFQECDWADFYEGAVEAILPMNPPRGKEMDLHCLSTPIMLATNILENLGLGSLFI